MLIYIEVLMPFLFNCIYLGLNKSSLQSLFISPSIDVHAFAYIGIHVKPSDAAREIDALINIYNRVMHIWRIKVMF